MANKQFVKVKTNVKEMLALSSGLTFIRRMDILVGIPEEANAGHGAMDNASLLYLHENGSPGGMIPARPVLHNGVHAPELQAQAQAMYKQAFVAALSGMTPMAKTIYDRIGILGANSVKAQFGVVGPPLKPATIARKGSSATLIDSGQLRNAITYVVRPK